MTDILNTLRDDHANLAELLDAVERQLAVFDRGERPDYEMMQGALEYCLDYPDLYHHPMEDSIMRRLRARDPATAEAVGDLEAEHRALNAETRRFAAVIDEVLQEIEVRRDVFEAKARSFIQHYRDHMRKEEEVFLPAAAKALSPRDLAEIEAEVGRREDLLFGAAAARFEALRENLMKWAQ